MHVKKLLLAACLIAWSVQTYAVGFVVNGGVSSITIVNLTTGAITVCPTVGEGEAKNGACMKSSVSLNVTGVAGLATNVSINPTTASLEGEVITNLVNGDYVSCNIIVTNGSFGAGEPVCFSGTAF